MDLKTVLGDAYRDDMTLSDVEAALKDVDIYKGYVSKDTADKYASEAAQYRKELKAKMSQSELEQTEAAEKMNQLQTDYDSLLRKVKMSENRAEFLRLGYDEKLAAESAEALINNDLVTVFKNQEKFINQVRESVKADLQKQIPTPQSNAGVVSVNYADQIDAAIAEHDMTKLAYYQRLQYEQSKKGVN
ncbi:hypothetical protein J6V85_03325 [Candidatus Saccharibacteria bacterium]|nr:hypothetical protein [Candidatus Saccharibacteria bacterium]